MSGLKVVASTPAKVILFGEHSVVYGTAAIATTISRNTIVVVSRIVERFLEINLERFGATCKFELPLNNPVISESYTQPIKQAIDCCLLVFGSLKFIVKEGGILITVTSDFTPGAGLGSSASFSVSLTAALMVFADCLKGEYSVTENFIFDNECTDKIKELSHKCEQIFHGNPSGIDTATCMLGGIVQFKKGEEVKKIANTFPMKVAVVHSGVERQTSKLVERVRVLKDTFEEPVGNIIKTIGMVVAAAVEEITNPTSDDKLINLVRMNHGLLSALNVSHPILEKISICVSDLPVGFKLTGAGGGGNALIFIPNDINSDEIKEILSDNNFESTIVDLGVEGLNVKIVS